MRAVREIQPEDIRAGIDQAANHQSVARRRSQGRHDLGAHLPDRFFIG